MGVRGKLRDLGAGPVAIPKPEVLTQEINMKLVKSLLLGSAAGICAVAGAQAADLPVRAAAPVEYVRVCTAYGAGFFYIPGTDTCLRIGGRARFSYQYSSARQQGPSIKGVIASNGAVGAGDSSGYESLAFINLDSRTQTGYGTLRTFIRVIAGYGSGGFLRSGSAARFGQAYDGVGNDIFGRGQTIMYLDKAFIQFAGLTAGRASSFFDFYAHDLEFHGTSAGSDVPSTTLLAYTMTFGSGWSATVSAEDPTMRRQPLYTNQTFGTTGFGEAFSTNGGASIVGNSGTTALPGTVTQSVAYTVPAYTTIGGATSTFRFANYDVQQRDVVPDVVGAIRYDAPWGAFQVSAAMHELRGGALVNTQQALFSGTTGLLGPAPAAAVAAPGLSTGLTAPGEAITAGTAAGVAALPTRIKSEIGWAIQGGLKLNLPQLAPGDVLWLQAAYSEGAMSYGGVPARWGGRENVSVGYSGRFPIQTVDSFIGSDFKQHLTETWSVSGAFLHYWSPEWRSAVFGSYAEVNHGKGARNGTTGPGNLIANGSVASIVSLNALSTLKDYSAISLGANLIWSPVKDLDIGIEGLYSRVDLKGGPVADLSKGSIAVTGLTLAGVQTPGSGVIPIKTVKYDDVFSARVRVQRDF